MKIVSPFYRFINLLSLDVAVGAAIGAAFFAHILDVALFFQAYVVLGLTVWIIYTSDHLLDAYLLDKPASTARHLLHQRHFTLLLWILVAAFLLDVIVVLFIRTQLMIPGLIMAVVCAAYLLLNRWLKVVKEIVGTLLYSGGVLLPALSLNSDLTFNETILVAQFVLIVFINMLLFARMSYSSDLRDKQHSLVTTIGLRACDALIVASFLGLGTIMLFPSEVDVLIRTMMAAMGVVLLLIFVFREYFRSEERYRLVGDFIFLLPGIVLILR